MERGETETDFAYRNLIDPEEQSTGHTQEDGPVTIVTHGDVDLHLTASAQRASVGTPQISLLMPEEGSTVDRSVVRALGENEPNDWNSEEGTRQGVGRGLSRHGTLQDMMRRGSLFNRQRIDLPTLLVNTTTTTTTTTTGASTSPVLRQQVLTPQSKPSSPVRKPLKQQASSGPKETLHGKDIGHFMSIGSIDQIARHSNSIDWSEAMAMPDEPDHLTLMDPYYDLTKVKLSRVFSLFHPDESGMVSYDGFRRGLEAMGIFCADDEEFHAFISKVDEDHSGGISFDEFQQAIHEIKLAQLFKDDFVHEMALDFHHKKQLVLIGSMEYSPDRIRSVYPIGNVEKFIYSKKPSWAAVRWINVEGCDPLLIRRLSVRYRLHPLAVEDALDVDRERPKYETYDEHSSLILQTVRPVDMAKLRNYQRMYRNSLYDRDDGPSMFDKMDKKELEERVEDLRVGSIMTNPEQISVYMFKNVLISVQDQTSPLWGTVKARLETSYSKIRQNGTQFLAYTIIDACVDDLTPIVHTLGAKLVMLERLVALDPKKFDESRLHHCSKQLKGLKRLCKPLQEVIVQMSESNDFTGEILRYFRDVQDHIAIVQEDCDKHLDSCKSLVEQLNNIRAGQQNDVSFVLTLVAAIFLPAQFLTGLEGMNFDYMPELRVKYGYLYWWMLVLLVGFATTVLFRKKKWI